MSLAVRSISCPLGRSSEGSGFGIGKRSHSLSCSGSKRIKLLTPEQKMTNNFYEAILEVGLDFRDLPRLALTKATHPLYLSCTATSLKGPVRPSMEDAHFDIELEEGHLVAILDGHGENGRIARQVATIFKEQFALELAKNPQDIRKVLIDICKIAHNQIVDRSGGTTALLVYFHNATNRFYTATLGDSEMRIYRKVGEVIKAIPVSLVRDWKSPKDEGRYLKVIDLPQVKAEWLKQENAKLRRFPGLAFGINTSRSLGDLSMVWKGATAISRKPKVSMCQGIHDDEIQDKVVFACDGLWDFATNEQHLIDTVLKPYWDDPELSDRIAQYAINVAKSQDNVTVIVGTLSKEAPAEDPPTRPITRCNTEILLESE